MSHRKQVQKTASKNYILHNFRKSILIKKYIVVDQAIKKYSFHDWDSTTY